MERNFRKYLSQVNVFASTVKCEKIDQEHAFPALKQKWQISITFNKNSKNKIKAFEPPYF